MGWWWLLACRDPAPADGVVGPSGPVAEAPETGLSFDGPVPTRLLVISLDTTRRDHLGAFGGAVTTPFLDALLADGVVLADHRSCSNWTAPSMLCASTGRSPLELGFWPGSGDPRVPGVPAALPSLPRLLGKAGYASRLVTGNAVFSSALAADGFDREIVLDQAGAKRVAEAAVAEAADLAAADRPFYLHVHFMDPHRPYCPPEEAAPDPAGLPPLDVDVCDGLADALATLGTRDAAWRAALLAHVDAAYSAELRWFDEQLRWMWEQLDQDGVLDDTLVLFHTDHGEQHLERGVVDHGFELHAEENRAAAAFWARGLAPDRVLGPTLHQDLAATLFALYGLAPETPPSGLVLSEVAPERVRRLFAYSRVDHGPPQLAVTRGARVLLRDWEGAGSYHDTDRDPAERVDAPPDAEHSALEAEWSAFADELRARWPHLGPPG